jgi:hypothetical protein
MKIKFLSFLLILLPQISVGQEIEVTVYADKVERIIQTRDIVWVWVRIGNTVEIEKFPNYTLLQIEKPPIGYTKEFERRIWWEKLEYPAIAEPSKPYINPVK